MNDNKLVLFETNIGSHIWKMQHEESDIDLAVVYVMDSKDFLLGKRIRGKQVQTAKYDYTYYEIGHFTTQLLKSNVNYIWAVMSPIIISEYNTSLRELKRIFIKNLSKNAYYSINGLANKNLNKYIKGKDSRTAKYHKKLNIVARTLKFGINILSKGKIIFQKAEVESVKEIYQLQKQLDHAFKTSKLPEAPPSNIYDNYLVKWRKIKMRKDGLIK